jgi:hypothetical protein
MSKQQSIVIAKSLLFAVMTRCIPTRKERAHPWGDYSLYGVDSPSNPVETLSQLSENPYFIALPERSHPCHCLPEIRCQTEGSGLKQCQEWHLRRTFRWGAGGKFEIRLRANRYAVTSPKFEIPNPLRPSAGTRPNLPDCPPRRQIRNSKFEIRNLHGWACHGVAQRAKPDGRHS